MSYIENFSAFDRLSLGKCPPECNPREFASEGSSLADSEPSSRHTPDQACSNVGSRLCSEASFPSPLAAGDDSNQTVSECCSSGRPDVDDLANEPLLRDYADRFTMHPIRYGFSKQALCTDFEKSHCHSLPAVHEPLHASRANVNDLCSLLSCSTSSM